MGQLGEYPAPIRGNEPTLAAGRILAMVMRNAVVLESGPVGPFLWNQTRIQTCQGYSLYFPLPLFSVRVTLAEIWAAPLCPCSVPRANHCIRICGNHMRQRATFPSSVRQGHVGAELRKSTGGNASRPPGSMLLLAAGTAKYSGWYGVQENPVRAEWSDLH